MPRFVRHTMAFLSVLLLLEVGQAGAVEVPLSHASFERALGEGRACESIRDMDPPIAAKASLEGVAQAIVNNAIAYPDSSYNFVTVRLDTPYARVRRLACQAKLSGGPLDEDEIWRAVKDSATISLWVVTESMQTKNDIPVEDQLKHGLPEETVRTGGPRVERVALRLGKDRHAVVIDPISEGAAAYDFPADALQGRGPFYVIIHTVSPDMDRTLKLKRSALEEP